MKDLLHPAEQEVLDELAEELDNDLDLSSIATILHQVSQSRTRRKQPHILRAMNYPVSLLSVASPEAPSKSASKKKESARLSAVERERFEELDGEVEEIEKNSRRLPIVPTLRELKHLFQTVRQARGVKARRDYLILRTLYATGCRRSELENILYADIDFPEQRIFIRDGKWNKDRYVLIDKQTASLLEEYTAAHTDEMPLFDIEDRQINRRVVHWGEKSGIYISGLKVWVYPGAPGKRGKSDAIRYPLSDIPFKERGVEKIGFYSCNSAGRHPDAEKAAKQRPNQAHAWLVTNVSGNSSLAREVSKVYPGIEASGSVGPTFFTPGSPIRDLNISSARPDSWVTFTTNAAGETTRTGTVKRY